MADTATAQAKSPAKRGPKKPKTPSVHPKYKDMIAAAIASLKERGGSSRQAILKYILAHYKVGPNQTSVNAHLKLALRAGTKSGLLKQSKGVGATGSFSILEKKDAAKKKPAKKTVKKPKKSTPKKAKKPAAKKSPKKQAKKQAAKKPAAKKPAAKKPAAKKPASKKPAAKKPAKKPAAKKTAAKK